MRPLSCASAAAVLVAAALSPTFLTPDGGWTSPVDWLICPSYPVHEGGAIIVTGANRGLGYDMALELDRRGFTVIASMRNEKDGAALKAAASQRLLTVVMDQTIPDQVKAAAENVSAALRLRNEKIVGLVCNAGITVMGPSEATDLSVFESILSVNVLGTMRVIKAFLADLRKNNGRIAILGAPNVPLPQYTYKTSANGALLGIARSLRVELAGKLVSISLIAPAATEGGMVKQLVEKVRKERSQYSDELLRAYPEPRMVTAHAKGGFPTFSPSWATDAVIHSLTAAKPKTFYTTTPLGTWLYFLSSLAPDRVLDFFLARAMGTYGL